MNSLFGRRWDQAWRHFDESMSAMSQSMNAMQECFSKVGEDDDSLLVDGSATVHRSGRKVVIRAPMPGFERSQVKVRRSPSSIVVTGSKSGLENIVKVYCGEGRNFQVSSCKFEGVADVKIEADIVAEAGEEVGIS